MNCNEAATLIDAYADGEIDALRIANPAALDETQHSGQGTLRKGRAATRHWP
jgi:hypothetical protein